MTHTDIVIKWKEVEADLADFHKLAYPCTNPKPTISSIHQSNF